MIEFLQCLQLNALKAEITTSATLSNLLLALYCLALLKNKKGFYIGAFLLTELLGASFIMDGFSNIAFYLVISSAFALCYWYELKIGKNIRILFAYGIMVLFQSMMVLDAYIYPGVATRIYQAYEYIVVVIHLYIIIVLIDIGKIRAAMGDCINGISDFLGIGYNLSFCYTCHTILNKTKRQCR